VPLDEYGRLFDVCRPLSARVFVTRRSAPQFTSGQRRAEGFTSSAAQVLQNKRSASKAAARIHKPPDGGFLLAVHSGRVSRYGAKHVDQGHDEAAAVKARGIKRRTGIEPNHCI
jgi:hypothetical protein